MDLREQYSQKELAERYSVSLKTISRICTGKTWSKVSESKLQNTGISYDPSNSDEFLTLYDEIISIKNHFGFDFSRAINWGYFESFDGLHGIVTDGYILWESLDLVNYIKKISKLPHNEEPFFSNQSQELPTFLVKQILINPIGNKLITDITNGSIVRLTEENNTNNSVLIRKKYIDIAHKNKFEIRLAGNSLDFVYFTKSTNKVFPIIFSCVTTIKE